MTVFMNPRTVWRCGDGIGKWLSEVGRRPRPESLGHLRSIVGIDWVREALMRTGTESKLLYSRIFFELLAQL
jgi:hypothetical protein